MHIPSILLYLSWWSCIAHGIPLDETGPNITVSRGSSPTQNLSQLTATEPPNAAASDLVATTSSFQPSWEAINITCDDWLLLEPSDQWQAANANATLQTFRQMYLENQLLCEDCYGMSKTTCTSDDPTCQNGLQDLAQAGDINRWDQALGIFAQSQADLNCAIQDSSQCSQAPQCDSEHGPAGLALLKSMTTMHNSLSNIYMAIDRAHIFAGDQMKVFSQIFAPVKSSKNKAIFTEIMFVVAGVMAGCIPVLGAAVAASLVVGVGAAFVMNNLIFDQPGGPDTSTVLGQIVDNAQGAYSDVADALFTNGSYTYKSGDDDEQGTTISWASLMADGKLLQQQDNMTDALEIIYERMLYQQLAVYTWLNLESEEAGHIPFIAFDNQPCDQINKTNKSPLEKVIGGVSKSDGNITYNGVCYYLLDGTTKKDVLQRHSCIGKALPGGTNKDLEDYQEEFRDLSVSDFIIPSIKGWQTHNQQNGYKDPTATGQIYTDPQDAGAVSFPVCDYLGKPDAPGVGCPKFGKSNDTSCFFFDESIGINQPGDFVEGWCGVHIEQFQRRTGGNPLDDYQLSVDVFDGSSRPIGSAIKQSSAKPLDIINSVLPYDLHVATGASDEEPVFFWYADQYWNSTSEPNQCSVGPFDHGSRKMDCGFHCLKPDAVEDPPASATVANPFPNTPVAAVGSGTTYVNTYITDRPITATATSAVLASTTVAAM